MPTVNDFLRGNITMVDDYLVKFGFLALFCAAITGLIFLATDKNISGMFFIWSLGMFIVSPFLLGGGLVVRKREKQCIAIWTILQTSPEIRLSQFVKQSGHTLQDIQRAVKKINSSGAALLTVDTVHDRLYDSRLQNHSSITYRCENCGVTSSASFASFKDSKPVCKYCDTPVSNTPDQLAANAQLSLVNSNTERVGHLSGIQSNRIHREERKKFNFALFLVLLVVFWPAAIVYMMFY